MVQSTITLAMVCILLVGDDGRPKDPPPRKTLSTLRDNLTDLAKRDQEARKELIRAYTPDGKGGFTVDAEIMKAVQDIDEESTRFLKNMVDEIGWPTIDSIGEEAAHSAWLLVQHADKDPQFQSRVLKLMEPLVPKKQVSPTDFGMLTDRVRLAQGKRQVYGTQFRADKNGTLRPSATENWERVNERRTAIGMTTIEEYAESLSKAYGDPYDLTPLPLQEK